MEHKTFISYKYDEAKHLRDLIINKLGPEGAKYYRGETSNSPDLTDRKTETIRTYLKDMIYDTSVLIVIISPNMTKSNWIDWEIEYALKELKRGDRTSRINGILGVIMNDPDETWFQNYIKNEDGHNTCIFNEDYYVYKIISSNRYNQIPEKYFCANCKSIDALEGSYISFITQDDFLSDPKRYINNAYEKSQNVSGYDITKRINNEYENTIWNS